MLAKALVLTLTLAIGCAELPKPKFADAAELICDGLQDVVSIHNEVISAKVLMEQHDYQGALDIVYGLVQRLDEAHPVKGANELRALLFLLEGIVKGPNVAVPDR